TVHVRMKKMEQMGIVTGTQLKLNYINLGYDVNAFLGIYLRKSSMYNEVLDQLRRIPEVINVNYTTGVYSMFAKVICKDTMHLKNLLTDKIQKIPGIQRTETLIALEESINRPVQLL
ncbi:MAG: Lrp/AsnC ligand binding domain-containing protein, partial [Bacteroidota bacterium]|nr:Lrp/AsnC ligand binding domain-containing protein [Bacteroidota bacterium]